MISINSLYCVQVLDLTGNEIPLLGNDTFIQVFSLNLDKTLDQFL